MPPVPANVKLSEAEKLSLCQNLYDGVQLVATAEALSLGAKTGLNVPDLYQTVKHSAGSSKMFETRGANMLQPGSAPTKRTVKEAYEQLSSSLQVARDPNVNFNAPIATVAEQLLLAACGAGLGNQEDSAIAKLYPIFGGKDLSVPQKSEGDVAGQLRSQKLPKPKKVCFVGLGSMGLGMATILLKAGFHVVGYDNYPPSMENFEKNGGTTAKSAAEAAKDADVLVCMPIYLAQAESILFEDKVIDALADGAVTVICSTCPPTGIKALGKRITSHRSSLQLIDAPVSGGAVRAAKGDLIIMASADSDATLKTAFPVLDAFASTIGNSSNLKILKGLGAGSSTKLIIQYQAGTHAVAGAEVIAFAARLGLDTAKAYNQLKDNGAGFIFTNRLGRSVSGSDFVESKTEIIVKDLGIVVSESRAAGLPMFLPAVAHTFGVQALAAGLAKLDDCSIISLWTQPNGTSAVSANLKDPHAK